MLIKTEKGRHELRPGNRTLGQRERAILLVADGQQSEAQMAALFNGEGQQLLASLLAQGYLERREPRRLPSEPAPARPVPAPSPALAGTPSSPARPEPPAAAAQPQHGEQFAGARSLASARMFLFDMSERLFAPRDKAMADRYRAALREARDPQAMLQVSRALIADVETIAGSERADSISERLAKLLPADLLEQRAA